MHMYRSELKEKLKNRQKLFGGWISYDHPAIVETFALSGFDFISIDMEHAPITLDSAQRIISISQSYGVPCFPRPVSHSNDYFKPLLDSGADGLTVQMVNNYKELKEIINNLKYPPIGERTYGINRAQSFGLNFKNYVKSWNQDSSLIVQIESKEGIENIEEIASESELDAIMIGPYDLSGSYGVPGQTEHSLVKEACLKVIKTCEKYGKSCGTQISVPNIHNINEAFKLGYTYVIMGSDLFAITNWCKEMRSIRKEIKKIE